MLSFEELYSRYATDILRTCYFYLGDRQRAEDVCHDVFLKLLSTKPELESGKEKSWLLKVALNRCKDLWRSGWLKRVTLGDEALAAIPAPDHSSANEEAERLLTAVHKLPIHFREAVLLYYYQNLQINEIAKVLGVSEGTVSSRLSRAKDKLKIILSKQEG